MRTRDGAHSAHSTSDERYGDPDRTALSNGAMSIRPTVSVWRSVEAPSYTSDGAKCIPVNGNTSDDNPGIWNEVLESDLRSLKLSQADLLYGHSSHDTIAVQKNNVGKPLVDR